MAKFVVVIADTRVGSTALGSGLGNGSTIQFLGEILYPQEIASPRHLYGHVVRADLRRMAMDRRYSFEVLDRYFDADHWAPSATYVADIKYNDFRIIPEHPWGVLSRPLLLDYLVGRSIPIIHLNRRNKIAAALSAYVAMGSGVLHSTSPQNGESVSLEIDPVMLASEIKAREQSHVLVSSWLANESCVSDLDYEALFADGGKEWVDGTLRRICGAESDFQPKIKKLSDTRRLTISNESALELSLRGRSMDDIRAALAPYRL